MVEFQEARCARINALYQALALFCMIAESCLATPLEIIKGHVGKSQTEPHGRIPPIFLAVHVPYLYTSHRNDISASQLGKSRAIRRVQMGFCCKARLDVSTPSFSTEWFE